MTKVLTLLLILVGLTVYSQGITDAQKLEAVRNAQRVEVLSTQIAEYEARVGGLLYTIDELQGVVDDFKQDRDLWKENYSILQTRYDSLEASISDGSWWQDFFEILKWLAIGFASGVVYSSL